MAYHAFRTIANNNEAINCYFVLDKNKNKTQARLHLMMKKKKQLTPLQTIEALIPRNFVEDFQKRANRERLDEIAPRRLKLQKFDKSNLSFGNGDPLRMLVAKERIEDLRGNLLCFTDASKTEDGLARIGIYISQKFQRFEAQYQNFKSQQHQLHGTSSHREFPVAREGILPGGNP